MDQQEPLLRVRNLTKIFTSGGLFSREKNAVVAVNNVSFDLNKGEILGLLGPNGSGKTTIMHMLIATLQPTSGSIHFLGNPFLEHAPEILQNIGFASSSLQIPSTLSVTQNLDIHGRLYGLSQNERTTRIEALLKNFGIWDIRKSPAGNLSFGQTMRVMIAKVFLTNPQLVLLDEATSPLDPEIAKEVRRFILEHRNKYQTSLIIASHNMQEVSEICDRILVLQEGKIIIDDAPHALLKKLNTVHLVFPYTQQDDSIERFLQERNMAYSINNKNISIDINEQYIAPMLQQLAHANIGYQTISINKPTLEDYFLRITTALSTKTSPKTEAL